MKKKLLVTLGAGSSISCNMPSVACLDEKMQNWGQAWATVHGSPDYFAALWQDIETCYRGGKHRPPPSVNFEKVLGEMIALFYWMTPPPQGDTLRQTACDGAPPPRLTFPAPMDYGPVVAVRDQFSHLSKKLANHMRMRSRSIDRAATSVRKYKALFDGLRGRFDVGVYNLNYDTVALTAWPEAYVGFDAGAFDAGAVHARSEWGFIYHLHGSVRHSLVRDRIKWRPDLAGAFFDSHPGHVAREAERSGIVERAARVRSLARSRGDGHSNLCGLRDRERRFTGWSVQIVNYPIGEYPETERGDDNG